MLNNYMGTVPVAKSLLFVLIFLGILAGALITLKVGLKNSFGAPITISVSTSENDGSDDVIYQIQTYGTAPELDGAVSWLNTDHPIRLADLRGKIVLLDFWTYCCINCMHILPDLAYLEEKYSDELVVIGVHSAKFENEKDTENIRQAILRYEIKHPVANDANFYIWRRFDAHAWLTLVLIDPEGQIVGQLSGEGHRETLDQAVQALIALHNEKGTLDSTPVHFNLEADEVPDSFLRYPGKVHVEAEIDRVFISDSNHNRIVIADLDGNVKDIAGSGESGLSDGSFENAEFFRPQGMAYSDGILYVADTENHAIRALDLQNRTVGTFGGNGRQGNFSTMSGGPGTLLSSPWDLEIVDGIMYIAMAGTHQIWKADLETRDFKGFAGNSGENIVDGAPFSAQLAQPSGISYGGGYLYFADSEVSAVRRVGLGDDRMVETLVGEGLFEFGDIDGSGSNVRLQHPLGVLYHGGKIYVADTYNHKVKILDPSDRSVRTFLGTGTAGWGEGAGGMLNEPGDLAIAGNDLYIADTNSHRIAVADINTGEIRTLNLRLGDDRAETASAETVRPGDVSLRISITLPDGFHLTEEAPFGLEVKGSGGIHPVEYKTSAAGLDFEIQLNITVGGELTIMLSANYCSEGNSNICALLLKTIKIPVTVDETGNDELQIEIRAE